MNQDSFRYGSQLHSQGISIYALLNITKKYDGSRLDVYQLPNTIKGLCKTPLVEKLALYNQ